LHLKQLFFAEQRQQHMTILLVGSGGREHAFAWKMIQSPFDQL
jgi:phosphoribosylamine--glycine ligase